jgi:hypothetical protein
MERFSPDDVSREVRKYAPFAACPAIPPAGLRLQMSAEFTGGLNLQFGRNRSQNVLSQYAILKLKPLQSFAG